MRVQIGAFILTVVVRITCAAAVAQKIVELAKAGERDPERLCEGALKATQPVIPVLISDPNPPPPPAGLQAPAGS